MLNLSRQIEIQRPSILQFGEGAVSVLAGWVEASGFKKPFVVADRFNAARLDMLGLRRISVFGDVEPEPDEHNLDAAIKAVGITIWSSGLVVDQPWIWQSWFLSWSGGS